MRADDAKHIDALARERNREEGESRGGCLTALLIGLACWIVIFAAVGRLYRWWTA